jgi:hypothetical protein
MDKQSLEPPPLRPQWGEAFGESEAEREGERKEGRGAEVGVEEAASARLIGSGASPLHAVYKSWGCPGRCACPLARAPWSYHWAASELSTSRSRLAPSLSRLPWSWQRTAERQRGSDRGKRAPK